jgi:hypothetical protein
MGSSDHLIWGNLDGAPVERSSAAELADPPTGRIRQPGPGEVIMQNLERREEREESSTATLCGHRDTGAAEPNLGKGYLTSHQDD